MSQFISAFPDQTGSCCEGQARSNPCSSCGCSLVAHPHHLKIDATTLAAIQVYLPQWDGYLVTTPTDDQTIIFYSRIVGSGGNPIGVTVTRATSTSFWGQLRVKYGPNSGDVLFYLMLNSIQNRCQPLGTWTRSVTSPPSLPATATLTQACVSGVPTLMQADAALIAAVNGVPRSQPAWDGGVSGLGRIGWANDGNQQTWLTSTQGFAFNFLSVSFNGTRWRIRITDDLNVEYFGDGPTDPCDSSGSYTGTLSGSFTMIDAW